MLVLKLQMEFHTSEVHILTENPEVENPDIITLL